MRKANLLLSLLIIFALGLAACSSGNNNNNNNQPTATSGVTTGQTSVPGLATGTQSSLGGGPAATSTSSAGLPVTGLTGTPAASLTSTPSASATAALPATGSFDINRLTTLFVLPVVDQNGQAIGTAHDVVLNLCTATIDYVVVTPGPSAGVSAGNWVLIPWSDFSVQSSSMLPGTVTPVATSSGASSSESTSTALNGTMEATPSASGTATLTPSTSANVLVVNVPTSKINGAPTFIPGSLPNMNNAGWDANLRAYWGLPATPNTTNCSQSPLPATGLTGTPAAGAYSMTGTPAATSLPSTGATTTTGNTSLNLVILGRDLLGSSVQDNQGNTLGNVNDVIVNPQTGGIRYLVVSAADQLNIGQKLIVVPLGAFQLSSASAPGATGTPANSTATGTPSASMAATGTPGAMGNGTVVLVVNVSQQTFMQAPQFAYNGLPNTSVSGWDTQISSFWNQYIK